MTELVNDLEDTIKANNRNFLIPKYIGRKLLECVKDPLIFVQYVKYGLKLVTNLIK